MGKGDGMKAGNWMAPEVDSPPDVGYNIEIKGKCGFWGKVNPFPKKGRSSIG
jgi:hypothetical protein